MYVWHISVQYLKTGLVLRYRGYDVIISLPRLDHSAKWLCTPLKIGLEVVLLAQGSKHYIDGRCISLSKNG